MGVHSAGDFCTISTIALLAIPAKQRIRYKVGLLGFKAQHALLYLLDSHCQAAPPIRMRPWTPNKFVLYTTLLDRIAALARCGLLLQTE